MKIDVREMREGHVVEIADQRFDLVQVLQVETDDGKPSRLLVWESICAEPDCQEPFLFVSPGYADVTFNRRCRAHQRPGVPVLKSETVSPRKRRRALLDRVSELEAALAEANAKIASMEGKG